VLQASVHEASQNSREAKNQEMLLKVDHQESPEAFFHFAYETYTKIEDGPIEAALEIRVCQRLCVPARFCLRSETLLEIAALRDG
jgi:hypothetical protein